MEHIFHEANRAADFMASLDHKIELGLHVYCSSPVGLRSYLSDDARGVALPRLIG